VDPLVRIVSEARKNKKTVVLPEAEDARMLVAAAKATKEGIADIVLLGDPDKVSAQAKAEGVDLKGVRITDHLKSAELSTYANAYYELRKHKGVTQDQAATLMKDPLFYGAMMVRNNALDGMVAGAVNTTANVIRASVQIVGMPKGMKTVSSCFLMVLPTPEFGVDGSLIYSDCGVVPDPTAEQLVDIAAAAAQSCRALIGAEPVIAMLAFSTYGSASHPIVDKVIQATKLAKEKYPNLQIDGELQADSALIPSIGSKKAPGSPVAGKANTMIFPDLNAGNIAYKLTERLAKATAIGPLLQGVAKPVNDLSRGCSAEDIYNTIAITVVESQMVEK